ncbi:MAG: hypothetical protein ACNYPH_01480 [Gammaproteobacteria bacterium WSBS_2016_MAG_OTU1]
MQKTDADKKAAETKYILGMRILMLGLESALTSSSDEVKDKIDDDGFRKMAAKGVAQVVLTLWINCRRVLIFLRIKEKNK